MANRIQIRAGAAVPTTSNLLYRELGYSTGSKQLYINDNGTIRSIGMTEHTHGTYDRALSVLSGANVFSNIVVTDGIVTSTATRALTAANVGAAASAHTHAWAEVTSKPSTFAPSSHTHAWAQVTGPPAQATRWPTWTEVTSKPTTFAPATHTHAYAASTHTHAAADLPNAYSLLWSGTISTAAATATLNSAYSNFDFLIVVIALDNASSENHVPVTIPVGTISTNARRFSSGLYLSGTTYMYLNFTFPSATSIQISNFGGALTKAIRYVYGVKIA